jgi:hypothetical protein
MDRFFKYKLMEPVIIDLGTKERKSLTYKWSLHPGDIHPPFSFTHTQNVIIYTKTSKILIYILFTSRVKKILQIKKEGGILSEYLTWTLT